MKRLVLPVAGVGKRQRGQGLVEYGLILLLVAIVVIVALTAMGTQLKTVFDTIKNTVTA